MGHGADQIEAPGAAAAAASTAHLQGQAERLPEPPGQPLLLAAARGAQGEHGQSQGVPEGPVQPRAVEGGSLPASPALHLPWGPGPFPRLPLLEYPGLPGARPPWLPNGGRADRVFHHDPELAGGAGGAAALGPCPSVYPPGDLGG
ncbi:NYN domain and retroviral integrase containing [Phyllostomus discolor]|uniref:NYN domain and retroviral integrase containing n=1 Tax=Phyllostomus discolor TaxID=89673 RepID=A0A834ESM3_9CHIR|nr:NYN domain and retroviral integrase containing [Phyllostomus discolor]